jgi:hypothetical protein
MKFINENTYSQGRGKISSFLNRRLHEFLGMAPARENVTKQCAATEGNSNSQHATFTCFKENV